MKEYSIKLNRIDFFLGFGGSELVLRRPTFLFLDPSPEPRLLEFALRSAFSFAFLRARLFCAGVFRLEGISIAYRVDVFDLCHL